MTTAFSALEARVNAACTQHLANATANYNGGPAFGVMFDRAGNDPFDGALDATGYSCSFSLGYAPGLAKGDELVIDGVIYIVSGPVQPDSSGWVHVPLYPKE
ncbi:MAG: hypothetical protein K2Y10_11035 [Burkholderiaceae bacterium]|nr:hypothetical protein [Burkholderiaceae bacterium]